MTPQFDEWLEYKRWLEDYEHKARAAGGGAGYAAGGPTDADWDAPKDEDWVDKQPSIGDYALKAASDAIKPIVTYPATQAKMAREGRADVERGIRQIASPESAWDVAKGVGNVGLGALGWGLSPINALYRTVAGEPLETHLGIPKEYTEFGLGLATPGIGLPRVPRRTPSLPPPPPTPPSIAGVTLTEGEATRALPLIQKEQGALRGEKALGEAAHEHAQAFRHQREGQIAASHENVARALDPYGQVVAETPIEAGRLVSEGLRSTRDSARTGVDEAYRYARSLPGEAAAGAFEGTVPQIKNMLTMRDEPIIIDKLTPIAGQAMEYLEKTVGRMRIPNRASLAKDSVYGEVAAGNDAGISLRGIEQWRKNIIRFRDEAQSVANRTGQYTDARAARAIADAFDDHVESIVRSPAFRGDPRVVQAYLDARAAHADYRTAFGKQAGRDPVGAVVNKVIGDRHNDPAIASDVANFAFGASGVVPNSTNVGFARRAREILGPASPEWSAVKQGLWARLTENAAGDPLGGKKTADRIRAFLANPEAANVYYAPWQQDLMREYAEMHRRIAVPQAGAQWSNNVTTKTFENISNKVGTVLGAIMGGSLGKAMGVPVVGELAGAAAAQIPKRFDQAKEARLIREQMPILAGRMQAYARAVGNAQAKSIPAPTSERARQIAIFNLDKSLRMFGTSLEQVSAADPKELAAAQ